MISPRNTEKRYITLAKIHSVARKAGNMCPRASPEETYLLCDGSGHNHCNGIESPATKHHHKRYVLRTWPCHTHTRPPREVTFEDKLPPLPVSGIKRARSESGPSASWTFVGNATASSNQRPCSKNVASCKISKMHSENRADDTHLANEFEFGADGARMPARPIKTRES